MRRRNVSVRVIIPYYSRPNIILNLARSVRWLYLINQWANRKYEAATFSIEIKAEYEEYVSVPIRLSLPMIRVPSKVSMILTSTEVGTALHSLGGIGAVTTYNCHKTKNVNRTSTKCCFLHYFISYSFTCSHRVGISSVFVAHHQ